MNPSGDLSWSHMFTRALQHLLALFGRLLFCGFLFRLLAMSLITFFRMRVGVGRKKSF